MKSLNLLVVALVAVMPAAAQEAFPGGDWRSEDGLVTVRIEPCMPNAATVCGTIVEDRRAAAEANPPGHRVLRDVEFKRNIWRGKFSDGSISGGVTLKLKSAGDATVKFCFAGILCETETWRRID